MPRVSAAAGLLSFGWAICPSGQGRLRRREERKARCLANGAYEGSKDFTIEVCTPLSALEGSFRTIVRHRQELSVYGLMLKVCERGEHPNLGYLLWEGGKERFQWVLRNQPIKNFENATTLLWPAGLNSEAGDWV
ncbi:hypothetical protein TNCT_640661 [Trichonephila clavata]|uniref:Uncharacterized protein n=1 Tax=Trichonephila clavata TaxID=2740835 RepID=A0A8X6IC70_TRICU|nr:hypothetical protein TNCT_640661 [Trichonephila clavata]